MRAMIRRAIIQPIIIIIVVILSLRCLQVCGVMRSLPVIAQERYDECIHGETHLGLAELHIRCPFCRGPIKAIYYGFADRHLVEYDEECHSLWEWRGCISEGTCWQCTICNIRFDKHGKSIWKHHHNIVDNSYYETFHHS